MAASYGGVNTRTTGTGTSSLTCTATGRSAGQLLVALFGNKPYSVTINTLSGWATGGTIASGTDASWDVRATAFTRTCDTTETNTWTSSANATPYTAQVLYFDKGASEVWDVSTVTVADTNASGTSISLNAGNLGLQAGDLLIEATYGATSSNPSGASLSIPGCTFTRSVKDFGGSADGSDIGWVIDVVTINTGSQTGDLVLTYTAAGGRSQAAATFTRIRAAAAPDPSEGSATGDVSITGSATGDEPPLEGAATGDVTITGSATGERPPVGEGSATGDMEFTGVAIGDMPPDVKTGTASGTLDIDPEASGVRDSSGEADPGSLDVTGSGEGGMPKYGSATGSVDVTGSAVGARSSRGLITPQNPNLSLTGAATGDNPGAGYVTTSTGLFAALHIGHNVAAGNKRNGKIIVGFDGLALKILNGGAVGEQGSNTRSGSAAGDLAVTGSATGTMPLSGVAEGSLTITGSASGDVPDNTGSATGSVTVTGSATGARDSLGSMTGALDATGAASGEKTVSGSATGSLTITGSTGGDVPPNDGSTSGTVTITAGTVDGRRPHKGSATAGFDGIALKIWDPTVIGSQPVQAGDATGSVSITGAAQGTSKHGAASGAVDLTGTALGRIQREGTAQPANQAPALIVLLGEASGSAPEPGEGSVSGSLTITGDTVPGVRDPVGSVTESVTVTGSATGNIDPNLGSSTGSYSLVGSASGKKIQKAVAVGSYSYSGTSTGKRTPKAAATGGYVITGGGVSATYRAGQATGTVNVAGVATGRRDLLADVTLVLDRGPYGNDLSASLKPRRTVDIDGPWAHTLAPALQPRRALRVGHPQQRQISIRSTE